MRASILLEDGTLLQGRAHGEPGECSGEAVFNTAMTGYEEVISDPSYRGQIVVFTTSHLGNTGITEVDLESQEFAPRAFICKDLSRIADNHRAKMSLEDFLHRSKRLAVSGVDTRFLTRRLREHGCMKMFVSTVDHCQTSLSKKLAEATAIVSDTSLWTQSSQPHFPAHRSAKRIITSAFSKNYAFKYRVAVLDFGIKKGIAQQLAAQGCSCEFYAPPFSAKEIEAIQPDGLFLSNGAGDPRTLMQDDEFRAEITKLIFSFPTFGICLGHQLIGLALGGRVEKLGHGHHAINHPVMVVRDFNGTKVTKRAIITSQNHNYHVTADSIGKEFWITHLHGNDGTVAGMRHRSRPIFSVQFHPEANPGPRDAVELFNLFIQLMEEFNARRQ